MKLTVYRVWYFTATEVHGNEVKRKVHTQPVLVAAKDHEEAAKLLPRHKPEISDKDATARNVVITCQPIHSNVIAAERLSLDEELAQIEAT